MTLSNWSFLFPPSVVISFNFSLSTWIKPVYKLMIEPNMATEMPATIIVLLPVPSHTIIKGARADFGSEFKITRYGSMILLNRSKDSIRIAVKILKRLTIKKLRMVSYSVIPVCMNISRFLHISINSRQMRDGELRKKNL